MYSFLYYAVNLSKAFMTGTGAFSKCHSTHHFEAIELQFGNEWLGQRVPLYYSRTFPGY